MSKLLKLGEKLSLPLDAVTQTFGVLAVRGAGKSNLAACMAEEMHAAGRSFVVIDPVGSWSGLRSSADGKKPGLDIPIFGGRRGDLPLERTAGVLLADLVVDKRMSCVLDVSDFSEGDKIRFLIDFGERLYRRNTQPLHLFLEEADDYIPQRPMREQARLLRVWENIVRRGRARGLGITMITQRSAAINKNVLTQIETLFVLRTTSPQDIKAIEAWVHYHGQSREVLASLSQLESGEAWVWSPSYLKRFERVKVRRRWTYDTGATPKEAKGAPPPLKLADVDLGELQQLMAETIERAKADNPAELRKQVAALKAELAKAQKASPAGFKLVPAGAHILTAEALERHQKLQEQNAQLFELAGGLLEGLQNTLGPAKQTLALMRKGALPTRAEVAKAVPPPARATAVPAPMQARASAPRPAPKGDLTGPEQRILDAIAWLESVGVDAPEQTAVAFLAGYTAGGGAFNNPRGRLNQTGLVEYVPGGRIRLTEAGRAAANMPNHALSSEELQAQVLGRLPGPERRLLEPLIQAHPEAMTNAELAAASRYTPGAGAFNNPRGRLKSLGLIEYPAPGCVRARDILFLGGARG